MKHVLCEGAIFCFFIFIAVASGGNVNQGIREDVMEPRIFTVMGGSGSRSWNRAHRMCDSVKMRLATIDIHAFYFILSRVSSPEFRKYSGKPFWIGLYNENTGGQTGSVEGEYKWEGTCQPTSSSSSSTFWDTGQPADTTTNLCVLANETSMHWSTGECQVMNQFICQRRDTCHYSRTSTSCTLYIGASYRKTIQGTKEECQAQCDELLVDSMACWGFIITDTGCVLHFQPAQPVCDVTENISDAYFRVCFQIYFVNISTESNAAIDQTNIPVVPDCERVASTRQPTEEPGITETPTTALNKETTFSSSELAATTEVATTPETLYASDVNKTILKASSPDVGSTSQTMPLKRPTCRCRCDLNKRDVGEALRVAAALKKELTLDRKSLSSARRRFNSAPDERVSSEGIAYVGIAFVTLVAVVILLPDVRTIFIHLRDGVPMQERRPRRRVCQIMD